MHLMIIKTLIADISFIMIAKELDLIVLVDAAMVELRWLRILLYVLSDSKNTNIIELLQCIALLTRYQVTLILRC